MTCSGCGGPLLGAQRRWCSDECRTGGARAARLAAVYGISLLEYEALFVAQGGTCAICDRVPSRAPLSVDHSHRTGIIRGLLCSYCNLRVVGRHTDGVVLARAADYLNDPPAVKTLGERVVPNKRPKKKKRTRRRRAA